MAFNKSIILIFILSSLVSVYADESGSHSSVSDSSVIESVCQKTQSPKVCMGLISPYLNGPNDANGVLQAGLQGFNRQLEKAIEEAQRLKLGYKTPDMENILDRCLNNYQLLVKSTKKSLDDLATKNYSNLETELNYALKLAHDCADTFTDGNQELHRIDHEELVPLAQCNLDIARSL